MTVLVGKLRPSGGALAYSCTAKGPSDTWVVRQIVRDLEEYGIKDICLKTDGEPAILALQEAIAKARNHRTLLHTIRRAMVQQKRQSKTSQDSYAG